jgi:hypothetical protein
MESFLAAEAARAGAEAMRPVDRTEALRRCEAVLTALYEQDRPQGREPGAAQRALKFLHDRLQTDDEKRDGVSRHKNDVGFCERDAAEGSRLADARPPLSRRDASKARSLARKYGMQVAEHATAEELASIVCGEEEAPEALARLRAPAAAAKRRAPEPDEPHEREDASERSGSESESEEEDADERPSKRCAVDDAGARGASVRLLSNRVLLAMDRALDTLGVDPQAPRVRAVDVLAALAPRARGLRLWDVHAALYHALRRVKPSPGCGVAVLWPGEDEWFAGTVTELSDADGAPWVEWDDGSGGEWVADERRAWLYVTSVPA